MSSPRQTNKKLQELQDLIDDLSLGEVFFFDVDGYPDSLTPLGMFVVKLEHIIQRDDEAVSIVTKLLGQ